MKIEEINPTIRFADRFEYTTSRPLSKTYDSRLIYVIDGAGSITVADKSESIRRGLLVLFQSGVPYKFEPKPSFVAFAVDFDLVGGYPCAGFTLPVISSAFDEQKAHERAYFDDNSFLQEPFLSHVHSGIGDDVRRLVEEYNSGRQFSKRRAEVMLASLFFELARTLTQSSKGAKLAERVVEYISEHYREPITNKGIAAHFGHEPCYLNRTVKFNTGMPIHRLLLKKRVEEGVKLLLATDLTLEEIAERVGFCTASHFSNRCKEISGKSPSFYRQK